MSEKSEKRTVKDIDHTHPHTDEPFGSWGVFDRGTSSSGDDEGDRVEAHPDDEGATDRVRRVKDIDHTPPDDVGAQRTFDRGEETPVPDRRRDDEDDDAV